MNISSLIELIEDGIETFTSEVQSLKTRIPIELTEEGIENSTWDEHLEKHELPILVTEDGTRKSANEEHPSKAPDSNSTTEEGIFISFKALQSLNVSLQNFVKPSGNVTL